MSSYDHNLILSTRICGKIVFFCLFKGRLLQYKNTAFRNNIFGLPKSGPLVHFLLKYLHPSEIFYPPPQQNLLTSFACIQKGVQIFQLK